MKTRDLIELIVLAAIWGASFLFMRTATPEFGAIPLVTVRTLVAALVLIPILLIAKKYPDVKRYWFPIFLVGLVNTAIPFCLFSYSTMYLGAGFASILNATAPMFGALVAFLWLKDNLSLSAVVGLFIGFSGVVVLSNARATVSLELAIIPIAAALLATLFYGIGACLTKRYLAGVSTLAIATGSQGFAALALIPVALFTLPSQMPSSSAWLQVILLGVACTAFAYILYFRLIANIGAAKAITVAYLVPVFGVMWGIVFLQEQLTLPMVSGALLILFGVTLTTGVIKRRKAYA